MKRMFAWLWDRGVVSTFLAGFFVVLPVAITIGIMSWVAGQLQEWLGPESTMGKVLNLVGLQFVTNETVASIVGWMIVLAGIWLLGALVKSAARYRLEEGFQAAINRIPFISTIYRPVSQVVAMLKKDDRGDMKGMKVVYCDFGAEHGGAFLGLQASENVFRFGDHDCHLVYIPTSPLPMSGGLVFVPAKAVRSVEMEVDDLMQIYFSLGVLSSTVVPERYCALAS
jgi:uncharacterized membrane protein